MPSQPRGFLLFCCLRRSGGARGWDGGHLDLALHSAWRSAQNRNTQKEQWGPNFHRPLGSGVNLRAVYTHAMQVWGFMAAQVQCDVCGDHYTLKHRHGRYIWQGTRRSHLCTCFEQEQCLASEAHQASGVRQDRYPQFLDFATMWMSGYSRCTIWEEMEQQGAEPGRREGRA